MKLLSASMLVMCLVFVGCAETATEMSADIANATNKVEGQVQGMTCSGCTGEVTAAVATIEGVTGAHADLGTKTVSVALEDGVDAEAKMQEIQDIIAGLSGGKYEVGTFAVTTADAPKTCGADCTKPCCAGEGEMKTCGPECTKPCCKPAEAAQAPSDPA